MSVLRHCGSFSKYFLLKIFHCKTTRMRAAHSRAREESFERQLSAFQNQKFFVETPSVFFKIKTQTLLENTGYYFKGFKQLVLSRPMRITGFLPTKVFCFVLFYFFKLRQQALRVCQGFCLNPATSFTLMSLPVSDMVQYYGNRKLMLHHESGTQGRFSGWKQLGPSLRRLVGAWDSDN